MSQSLHSPCAVAHSPFASVPAPLLEAGRTYLLFVTTTRLPGRDGGQFYITDAGAGYYATPQTPESITASSVFTRVTDNGDTLPGHLSLTELATDLVSEHSG